MQRKVRIFEGNKDVQTYTMAARNLLTSAAIFTADAATDFIMSKFGDEIEQDIGISKENAAMMINYSYRAACAWLSTCCHAAFARVSHGIKNSEEVLDSLRQDFIGNGEIKRLFPGALARTAFSLMAIGTIVGGPKLAEYLIAKTGVFSEEERKEESHKKPLRSAFGFTSEDDEIIRKANKAAEKSSEKLVKIMEAQPGVVIKEASANKVEEEKSNNNTK